MQVDVVFHSHEDRNDFCHDILRLIGCCELSLCVSANNFLFTLHIAAIANRLCGFAICVLDLSVQSPSEFQAAEEIVHVWGSLSVLCSNEDVFMKHKCLPPCTSLGR